MKKFSKKVVLKNIQMSNLSSYGYDDFGCNCGNFKSTLKEAEECMKEIEVILMYVYFDMR